MVPESFLHSFLFASHHHPLWPKPQIAHTADSSQSIPSRRVNAKSQRIHTSNRLIRTLDRTNGMRSGFSMTHSDRSVDPLLNQKKTCPGRTTRHLSDRSPCCGDSVHGDCASTAAATADAGAHYRISHVQVRRRPCSAALRTVSAPSHLGRACTFSKWWYAVPFCPSSNHHHTIQKTFV